MKIIKKLIQFLILYLYFFNTYKSLYQDILVRKPHGKCITSLDGFPLNDNNKNGIKYFSCILENLRDTASNYSCLKKVKIRRNIRENNYKNSK